MNPTALIICSLVGLAAGCFAATGVRVLREFSLSELEIYCLRRQRRDRYQEIIAHHDHYLLGAETLEVIGEIVAVVAGVLWTLTAWRQMDPARWTTIAAYVATATLVALLALNWIPWAVARLWAAPYLFFTWPLWRIADTCVWPLKLGGRFVDVLFGRLAGGDHRPVDDEEAFEDEIRSMVTAGLREGLLEEDAGEMIEGVIELGDADVADIMTPRNRVDAVDVHLPPDELIQFVIRAGRTRIPVYENQLDQIAGVLYVKDLLPELAKPDASQRKPLRELLRDAWFVPANLRLDALLREFLNTRNHLAIVVDEYHAVVGVVTIEDVLEEIVGEIIDESDKETDGTAIPPGAVAAELPAQTHLYELKEHLGLHIPDEFDYDTVGGLVVHQLRRIPQKGETIVTDGARITVLEVTPQRVERVRVERVEPEGGRPASGGLP